MQTDNEVNSAVKEFDDYEIRVYTRFATEWRDQRLTDGSPAEVAFWNALISLFVEERHRRKEEIRQLELLYQANHDRV